MDDEVKDRAGRPPRLSRAEQQARSRAALVRAAAESFAERGFHGATVEDITARAGFTRGAFYSNFSDKEELFRAVLDEHAAQDEARLAPLIGRAASAAELVEALRARAAEDELQWLVLLTELRLHALRNPGARARLAAFEQAQRAAYRRAVEHLLAVEGLEPPADPELMALIAQTLFDGVALHHHLEGDALAPQVGIDALDLLLRAVAALAVPVARPDGASRAEG